MRAELIKSLNIITAVILGSALKYCIIFVVNKNPKSKI